MSEQFECCTALQETIPLSDVNAPGLDALAYRMGTHSTFFAAMKRRPAAYGIPEDAPERYPLEPLKTRESSDPMIALFDSVAVICDVLCFYQERIVNEGYLRTATERFSLVELARLVGYRPRPGVASSVPLAFTLDKDAELTIPAGTRAQSVPAPGQAPQTFETTEPLKAKAEWSAMRPRLTRPHSVETILLGGQLYVKGLSSGLKRNDLLLVSFGDYDEKPWPLEVLGTSLEPEYDRTLVLVKNAGDGKPKPSDLVEAANKLVEALNGAATSEQERIELFGADAPELDAMNLLKDIVSYCTENVVNLLREDDNARTYESVAAFSMALRQPFSHLVGMVGEFISKSPKEQSRIWVWQMSSRAIPLLLKTLCYAELESQEAHGPGVSSPDPSPPLMAGLMTMGTTSTLPADGPVDAVADRFQQASEGVIQLLCTFQPYLKPLLAGALSNIILAQPAVVRVHALRVTASPFGSSASGHLKVQIESTPAAGEKPATQTTTVTPDDDKNDEDMWDHFSQHQLPLDGQFKEIPQQGWVIVNEPNSDGEAEYSPVLTKSARIASMSALGISGKTTVLCFDKHWSKRGWTEERPMPLDHLRRITVQAQSEELPLAEEPILDPIPAPEGYIALDGLYIGLQPGRTLVVSGEAVTPGTSGVRQSELATLSRVKHHVPVVLRAENSQTKTEERRSKPFTELYFSKSLSNTYKSGTVTVYGNVAPATHGETAEEILGSGDPSLASQAFTLRSNPLTYVPAVSPEGVESTLRVYVNGVQWTEVPTLVGLGVADRCFITKTETDGKTTVVFGDGKEGARLPAGFENVKAVYRHGIGSAGNVESERISMLLSKPLGLKEVINPIAASGGADADGRDAIRSRAPLAVHALDRLVSPEDYGDFCRTFAGIERAVSSSLSDGRRAVIHVTICGPDGLSIPVDSDLYKSLLRSIREFGDPHQPVVVASREMVVIVIVANIGIQQGYQWDLVEPAVRAALYGRFGFAAADFCRDVCLSEVISTMQVVEGVCHVDVDRFFPIEELEFDPAKRAYRLRTPDEIAGAVKKEINSTKIPLPGYKIVASCAHLEQGVIRPARIAFLAEDVPDTLILRKV